MTPFLSTKEVAELLKINEKMVYALISEKNLPASKVTGKWLFPRHLVEAWVEMHTINFPENSRSQTLSPGVLVLSGSNDLLLEKTISFYNENSAGNIAVFGNIGSMGGIRTLKRNQCHIAASHLLQEDGDEYNFHFAGQELEKMPVVTNFCSREQGMLLFRGNPKKILSIKDLLSPGVTIVNRPVGAGTRLLFDQELKKAGVEGKKIKGYDTEVTRHMDVGLEILSGRADAGFAIRPVATLLDLEFMPIRWERYDLLIKKERFFDEGVQRFLSILHDPAFKKAAMGYGGYDISKSGKMVFQKEPSLQEKQAKALHNPLL